MMRLSLLFSVVFFIASNVAATEPPSFNNLQSLAGVQYHFLEPRQLDRKLHIYVRLPVSHGAKERTYPTIYLLDGGITFPLMAGYYRYMELSGRVPEAILVGVSYGTDDWRKGNMRSTDFTAPSKERAHYGGADAFLAFFERELFPLIEGSYASGSKQRVVFGQSLGGQFVLHALLNRPDLFAGYIASNPALHRNLDLFLPQANANAALATVKLYVSSGEHDDARFRTPALAWRNAWQGTANVKWYWTFETLPGQNHFSAAPEAFRRGVSWVLAASVDP